MLLNFFGCIIKYSGDFKVFYYSGNGSFYQLLSRANQKILLAIFFEMAISVRRLLMPSLHFLQLYG